MTTLTITVTNFAANVLMRKLENEGVKVSVKTMPATGKITMGKLLHIIAEYCNESEANIKSKSRKKEYVYPRHLWCYLSELIWGQQYTLKDYATFINIGDHASVLHARKSIKNFIFFRNAYGKKVKSDIDAILNMINS